MRFKIIVNEKFDRNERAMRFENRVIFPTFVTMLRYLFLLIVLPLAFLATAQDQAKFFPESHQDIAIGMHWNEVLLYRGGNLQAGTSFSGLPQLTEVPTKDTLFNYTLFLFNEDSVLYEVIIEYKSHFELFKYMSDFYGPPNIDSKEWLLPVGDIRELYIWEFNNRWCIADGETYQ